MDYQIITQTSELEIVCQAARGKNAIALDTEFVRTRTFYPQLGLIQLYDGETVSLIDPVEVEDMTAFADLLGDENVIKVLHACGEDLEVFKHSFGCMPKPMLDTQLMAAFLGQGLSTGFASLVHSYLDIELDKSESRTDWLARPLSVKQLEYAAADVYYLLPIFGFLFKQVRDAGWLEASMQESQRMIEKRDAVMDPELAYLDIKGAWQLKPQQLAILKPLAKWRYTEAVRRDLALNFVFKENDLLTIARKGIQTKPAMDQEGMDARGVNRHSAKIISLVKEAKQTPSDQYPAKIERLMDLPGYKQLVKVLKDEVVKVSEQTGLATEFLASKKQLNQFIHWAWKLNRDAHALPDVMQGWRASLLADKLLVCLK